MTAKKPDVSGQVPSAQSLLPFGRQQQCRHRLRQAAMPEAGAGRRKQEDPAAAGKGQAEITQVGARAARVSPRTANHDIVRVRGPRPPPATSLLHPAPQRSVALLPCKDATTHDRRQLTHVVFGLVTLCWKHSNHGGLVLSRSPLADGCILQRQLETTAEAPSGSPWLRLASLVQPWDPGTSRTVDLPRHKHPVGLLWRAHACTYTHVHTCTHTCTHMCPPASPRGAGE